MTDTTILTKVDIEPVNAMEVTDAYNRVFNLLATIEDAELRNAALADLNTVYDMTSAAINTSERAINVSRALKAMLDEAMEQRDQAIMQLYTERKEAAEEREIEVAEAVCNFFMLDTTYATALLGVLQGYCDEYDIDGTLLEEVRDAFLTLQMEMQDADECDEWLNQEDEAQAS